MTIKDGYDQAGIDRYLGDHGGIRPSGFSFDMRDERVTISTTRPGLNADDIHADDLVTFPIKACSPANGVAGTDWCYVVNKPFEVLTARQPQKVCGVVAFKKLHNDVALCEQCYNRAMSQGVNGMMTDTDDDSDDD